MAPAADAAAAAARPALVASEPELRRDDFAKFGDFTVSTFVPGATRALTGTQTGDVVVWEMKSALHGAAVKDGSRRQAVQVMRIHLAPVTCLLSSGGRMVSGGSDGFVRFYDRKLRLEAWFENINAGGITSVSFDYTGEETVSPALLSRQRTFGVSRRTAAWGLGSKQASRDWAAGLGSKQARSRGWAAGAKEQASKKQGLGSRG